MQRNGVLTFFALTFAISWSGVALAVGPNGFPGNPDDFAGRLPMVVLAMLAGPSVGALLTVSLLGGVRGERDLLSHLRGWSVLTRPYGAALLVAPIVVVGVLTMLSSLSPVFRPGILGVDRPLVHLAVGLITGLAAGAFEEIGWTGVAVPRLRRHYGLVATGMIVGIVWGAWHLLVVWWGSSTTSGPVSIALYLPAMTLSFLPPYRVLMVWVHDRTRSLPLAMAMHASLTASVRLFDPLAISGWAIVAYNVALGAALWLVLAIGWLVIRRRRTVVRIRLRTHPGSAFQARIRHG